jgi:hypothetical protein
MGHWFLYSVWGCMLDLSEAVGIVLKKDSRYSFGGTR